MNQRATFATIMSLSITSVACDRTAEPSGGEAELTESGPRNAADPGSREVASRDARLQDGSLGEDDRTESLELEIQASRTLDTMRKDPGVEKLLSASKGVLLIPSYGQGAAVVGARGGEGVLLTQHDDQWSGPFFYDVGSISLGPQVGAREGEMAVLLMSNEALDTFKEGIAISLNAQAQLTIRDYSKKAGNTIGQDSDVVLWSDIEGAFVGASLGVTDVNWDDEENAAYHGRRLAIRDALSGELPGPESRLERQLMNL